ncbi:cell division protein ZipA [Marinobacter fonticola]|uniref:cell division protein ZipA n=1 Tax=Marinobacter fonticola TaxID=2603215 RepID=UPI0011E6A0B3|nr:cell division protein ZipA [Marinobacter fonticola]
MSLREWLIAIGALIILGIVIDGVRRMHRSRKEAQAISSGMGADDIEASPIDEGFNPELPNGGSRPVTADTLQERGYVRSAAKSRFGLPPQKPTRPVVSAEAKERQEREDQDRWPSSETDTTNDEMFDEPVEHLSALDDNYGDGEVHDDWSGDERRVDDRAFDDEEPILERESSEPRHDDHVPPVLSDEAEFESEEPVAEEPEPIRNSTVEKDTATRNGESAPQPVDNDRPKAGANRPDAREVIVINVLARKEKAFDGAALKKLFEACGLEFGDMDIYHRHEASDTRSPVQFSVANAVEPGTFRAKDMVDMKTPGISFFMSLPGPSDSLKAFEFMLETAQCVTHNLGGELKDERRSVMTPQTIEHCRQRIREFERKRRSQRVG